MSDLQHTLADLRRELAASGPLEPDERVLLESTMHDIQQLLARDAGADTDDTAAPAQCARWSTRWQRPGSDALKLLICKRFPHARNAGVPPFLR